MIGSAFAAEPVAGHPLVDAPLGSWVFGPVGGVGLLLVALILAVVLRRALTPRPLTAVEALVGIIAFVALVLPVSILPGSQIDAARAENGVMRDGGGLAANISDLRSRMAALEEIARDLQVQIASFAMAVSPRGSSQQPGTPGVAEPATAAPTATEPARTTPVEDAIVQIRYAPGAEAAAMRAAATLSGLFGEGRVLLVGPATDLANGDVDIQIF